MRHVVLHSLLCLSFLIFGPATTNAQLQGTAKKYSLSPIDTILTELSTQLLSTKEVYKVEGFLYERDGLNIAFDSATFWFYEPVNGKHYCAIVEGAGDFQYQSPFKMEQENMMRLRGQPNFQGKLKGALVWFGDSTYHDVVAAGTKVSAKPSADLLQMCKKDFKYSVSKDDRTIATDLALHLLGSDYYPFLNFNAYFSDANHATVTISPHIDEPVNFYVADGKQVSASWDRVVQCPSLSEATKYRPILTELAYDMDITIKPSMLATIACKMVIRAEKDNVRWLPLGLFQDLYVDSIVSSSSANRVFHRSKESSDLWVDLGREISKGSTDSFTVYYNGRFLDRLFNLVAIKTSIGWFPGYDRSNPVDFRLKFTYPDNYTLAGCGAMVSEIKSGDTKISEWKSVRPTTNLSFNIGAYKIKNETLGTATEFVTLYNTSDLVKEVMVDAKQSFDFYQKIFGPLPFSKFYVTEIPYSHGEAFPGMVHVTKTAFTSGSSFDDDDDDAGFLQWRSHVVAHEMAHQWWGFGVGYKSYRDKWLSEAFSEYSSLMYIGMVLGDKKTFFEALASYRQSLLSKTLPNTKNAIPPGPIGLGYRVNSKDRPRDYSRVIYRKGAWVLHMLRHMLLDLNTMKEEAFLSVMKEYFSKYSGKKASTSDFQAAVESVVGQDVGWFFDQWIYDNKIPTYYWGWSAEQNEQGQWVTHCRIRQTDVPEDFKMSIPLKVIYDDGSGVRLRAFMTGAEAKFDLPALPKRPKEIIFNDLMSVLCNQFEEPYK